MVVKSIALWTFVAIFTISVECYGYESSTFAPWRDNSTTPQRSTWWDTSRWWPSSTRRQDNSTTPYPFTWWHTSRLWPSTTRRRDNSTTPQRSTWWDTSRWWPSSTRWQNNSTTPYPFTWWHSSRLWPSTTRRQDASTTPPYSTWWDTSRWWDTTSRWWDRTTSTPRWWSTTPRWWLSTSRWWDQTTMTTRRWASTSPWWYTPPTTAPWRYTTRSTRPWGTTAPAPYHCPFEEFPCQNGQCIHRVFWCDGINDCSDRSDEERCYDMWRCPLHYFLCGSGECIPNQAVCDGYESCRDGSDERRCDGRPFNWDFNEFNPSQYKRITLKAKRWILRKYKPNTGWGHDTPRAIVALALYDPHFLRNSNSTLEYQLIAKDLQLSFAMKLLRNRTDPISLPDLSMHINALTALCVNPRRFHGLDLVRILRGRADMEPIDKISLPAYLTLCLVNETSNMDAYKISALLSHSRVEDRLDVQALGLLILTCISQNEKYAYLKDEVYNISHSISQNLGNGYQDTYTIALLSQALNAARYNDKYWNRTDLLNTLSKERQEEDGSFGDLLATYYALPILSGKSLISLKNLQCEKIEEFTNLDASDNEHSKLVRYSIFFGDSDQTFESMQLKVKNETNFFDIMKLAAHINPNFRFKYNTRQGSPVVYSIHNIPNDVERGFSWLVYIKSQQHNATWVPYRKSISELVPKDSDHVAFWYKNLI